MSDTVVRPTFYEGEILPAADLIATVDSSRAQLARHERYVHQREKRHLVPGLCFGEG